MVVRAIPMILRAQEADGDFRWWTSSVFRTLHRYGLIDPLRKLPPLPPDWRIVRSIPAPVDGLRTLAWDGERIWTIQPGDGAKLYAISPNDGVVVNTLPVNDKTAQGVGWQGESLLLVFNDPRSVHQIDPETGRILSVVNLLGEGSACGVAPVGNKIWVCDNWNPCIWEYDPAKPGEPVEADVPTTELKGRYLWLAGGNPVDIAVQDDSVWHCDGLAPLIIRSRQDGQLMDWGEHPFPESYGITYDGKNLWVLDNKNKRICIIEKTESGRQITEALATKRQREELPAEQSVAGDA